jgi:hypothetical protein
MRYCLVLFVVTLVACNDKPPAKTVFDPQVKALEKARGAEGNLRESAERRAEETESLVPPY